MPDPSAALAPPSPSSSLGPAMSSAVGQIQTDKEQGEEKIKSLQGELDQDIKSRDELRPPEFKPVPPPTPVQTDPAKQWASMAMLLAAFGSLKARSSMTTAMNSAAAALKGFREGDQAKTDAAYQSWKVANENAMAVYKNELETYRAILGDKTKTVEEKMAEIRAQTANNNNERAWDIAQYQGLAAFARAIEGQTAAADKHELASEKLSEIMDYQHNLADLKNSPEYAQASPIDKSMMELNALGKFPHLQSHAIEQGKAALDKLKLQISANEGKRKAIQTQLTAVTNKISGGAVTGQEKLYDSLNKALTDLQASDDDIAKKVQATQMGLDAAIGAAESEAPESPSPAQQGVPPAAIAYLKAHPETKATFVAKYGEGAADAALGK